MGCAKKGPFTADRSNEVIPINGRDYLVSKCKFGVFDESILHSENSIRNIKCWFLAVIKRSTDKSELM